MAHYIAVVHKDPDSDFGVSFPDFPGCITAGKDMDEAKDRAQEALRLHVHGILEDGGRLPVPSKLEEVAADPDFADAVAFLVIEAPDSRPRTVRINITVPETTLRRIDAEARKRGMSRSAFLVRAAQNMMQSGPSEVSR
ncbi:Predicted nuclease of the RNAse H fold, HicB family [Desulfacinum infernum DSM 9756]|uniref:Predicted nuclease of the RNAse H fold, HicB family n=1 Tax=Desulfacinum infernum DSM 9756 TaxID=1121391 RepID=A0A1M5FD64_9BACT|nr:type II toxin-antitoxin system HicB family antitoxin [Desulfacinum infernum]SHF89426.1 Predicted nuclease of the RNAse H fold, HicB family [Desulfacinum infernum DSM 9756]